MALGRVADAQGHEIQNAVVEVHTSAPVSRGCASRVVTDQHGNFQCCAVEPNRDQTQLTLEISLEGRSLSIAAWTFEKNVRQTIQVDPRGKENAAWDLLGKIVAADGGKPIQSAKVVATLATLPTRPECSARVESDQNGDFQLCSTGARAESVNVELTIEAAGYTTAKAYWTFNKEQRAIISLNAHSPPAQHSGTPVARLTPKRDETLAAELVPSQHPEIPWGLWASAAGAAGLSLGSYIGAKAVCPSSECSSPNDKRLYSMLFSAHWVFLVCTVGLGTWALVKSVDVRGAQPSIDVSLAPGAVRLQGAF
jgi:hypothetical protein